MTKHPPDKRRFGRRVVLILSLVAVVAFLWAYSRSRPLRSFPPYNNREAEERIRQEWERLGTDGLRAKLEAMAARRARLDEAAEKERKQEQLRRQETYFVALLALIAIGAALRLYRRWVGRHRAASDDRSAAD